MALLGNIGIRKPGTQDQWNDGMMEKSQKIKDKNR
jgi:hypothetical protein